MRVVVRIMVGLGCSRYAYKGIRCDVSVHLFIYWVLSWRGGVADLWMYVYPMPIRHFTIRRIKAEEQAVVDACPDL